MTGPEFAKAHGDSSTWMPADFDTETVLAEIDAHYGTLHQLVTGTTRAGKTIPATQPAA